MKIVKALTSGATGALSLTAAHQLLKYFTSDAPRMDKLGMRAIRKLFHKADMAAPKKENLFLLSMAGDLIFNSLYYSLSGLGKKRSTVKGVLLGIGAGVGAIFLPKPLGLNRKFSARNFTTSFYSMLIYLIGGISSGAIAKLFNKKEEKFTLANFSL